jgi:hypothetical protein
MTKTRVKVAFVNAVIALGVGAIIWVQWPEAMKSHSIGAGYEQGVGASIFLAALMTGIPALFYAVVAYLLLSHWLFRPDELKSYRARRLVESISTTGNSAAKRSTPFRNGVMWLVIAAGVAVIFLEAWRRVDARYASEGIVTEVLMMIVMGGILSIAFAGVVSVAFRFLFGLPVIASLPNAEVPKKQANAQPGSHDFID